MTVYTHRPLSFQHAPPARSLLVLTYRFVTSHTIQPSQPASQPRQQPSVWSTCTYVPEHMGIREQPKKEWGQLAKLAC